MSTLFKSIGVLLAFCAFGIVSIPASGHNNANILGCYIHTEEITSVATGATEQKTSFLNITKQTNDPEIDDYAVEGTVWGANFHACTVAVDTDPLPLYTKGHSLFYTEASDGVDCKFGLALAGGKLYVLDKNDQCGQEVFFCGVGVSLDGVTLTASETPNLDCLSPEQ